MFFYVLLVPVKYFMRSFFLSPLQRTNTSASNASTSSVTSGIPEVNSAANNNGDSNINSRGASTFAGKSRRTASSTSFNLQQQQQQSSLNSPNGQRFMLKKKDRAILIDKFSRWIFPLSFIVLNVCYWTYFLNDPDGKVTSD